MRKVLLLLVIGVYVYLWQISPAQACTGIITFSDAFDGADAFVKAKIISLDDTGGNGTIEIETYYKGSGPQNVLILANTIGEIRNGVSTCGPAVQGIAGSVPIGATVYMPLYETPLAGLYRYGRVYHFPEPDSTVYETLAFDDRYESESFHITEAELLVLVDEHTEQQPIGGSANELLMPSTLRISTATGAEYLLPLDGSEPVEITVSQFIDLMHEEYIHYGIGESQLSDLIGTDRDDDPCAYDFDCYVFSPNYGGIVRRVNQDGQQQRFLFAPTSSAIAVWEEESIEIRGSFEVINSAALQAAPVSHPDNAVWSNDGRQLAFSDQRGLWLWAVYDGQEPELLRPAQNEAIPIGLRFSPQGNYLAIQEANMVEYLDLISGGRLPDGLFSPDETNLLVYDTQTSERTAFSLCAVETMECSAYDEITILGDPLWLNNTEYLVNGCQEPVELRGCTVRLNNNLYNDEGGTDRLFIYQPGTELVAILNDDGLLEIRKREYGQLRSLVTIDASTLHDVERIQWLPSFLYEFDS